MLTLLLFISRFTLTLLRHYASADIIDLRCRRHICHVGAWLRHALFAAVSHH
jgi:hypothetical protein